MPATSEQVYNAFSNHYDRFVNWSNRLSFEMPFLLSQINKNEVSLKLLDAACGTGMHAIALAEHGFEVTGTDNSPGMIAKANDNARTAKVNIRLKEAGFGNFLSAFPGETFDAAICLGNSLPHILSPQDLSTALQDFHKIIRPGGPLIIQNRNFDLVLADKQRWMPPQSFKESEQEWLFLRFYDFLPNGLIDFNIITLSRSQSGIWSQEESSSLLRPLLKDPLASELIKAGFSSIAVYGGLDGSHFDPKSSGNLVIVAINGNH